MQQTDFQPLLVHLIELRTRLVRAGIGFLLAFAVCFYFSGQIYDFMVYPLTSVLPGQKLVSIGIASPFLVQMKMAAMAAFVVSLPSTLYQAWAFVAPGLYVHEKKMVLPLIVSSTVLFFCGMAFAYYVVFKTVFGFLSSHAPASMTWLPDSDQYLSFILGMFLSFGVTFEVPVAIVLLVWIGVVTVEKLRSWRPYVIVGSFVVAAVITPPDALSQCMLAIPLWLLFEVGCVVAGWTGRRKVPDAQSDPLEE
ncbi:twin-arginine translocase subunit TatC [Amantichitinum ursilacus]|uniref:Sec-independent protein translocase protein TatC n=1 Tax=Amantichitinum ursilacus TaxID=857265 RepID=A0A0N0XK93_9NEIS|nr:twin-arginine translocase subunit TatC [Amantichitinum ursilacus]KPC53981.1 Sec-independent protein translocase protein TatC [Amantichitinum ursilacus]